MTRNSRYNAERCICSQLLHCEGPLCNSLRSTTVVKNLYKLFSRPFCWLCDFQWIYLKEGLHPAAALDTIQAAALCKFELPFLHQEVDLNCLLFGTTYTDPLVRYHHKRKLCSRRSRVYNCSIRSEENKFQKPSVRDCLTF